MMKKMMALALAGMMTLSLAACGNSNTPAASSGSSSAGSGEDSALTYAVEAGSAGEEVANENGFQVVSVDSQAKALMEVEAGTADAAIIDLLMAGAMVGEGTSYPDLKVTDQKLNSEEYGIGCRKGSDLASYINAVLGEAYADGTMQTIAETYGVQEALLPQETSEFTASETDSDVAYIQDKGTLVIGITDFEPMDYKDADGSWIGFDADMAKAFAESLGVTAEFVEIDWDNKILELDSKTIDCVWNGMTLTAEVTSTMECSNAYCNNAQVVIVPADKASEYQSVESVKDLTFAAEAGSAGEAELTALGYTVTPVKAQSDALMEVAAGTSDAAVIDSLMAAAMVGEGTGYASLTYTCGLNSEEYGVGFRKGSDLAQKLNDFFKASYADGSMMQIAETYGVQAAIIEQK